MLPWLFKSGAAPVGAWLLLKPLLAKAVASSQPDAAQEEHKNPGPTYHDLFEDPNVWTPYEVAKAVVNSLLIMPFRIVLLLGVCVLAWASSKAVLLWHRAEWSAEERAAAEAKGQVLPARRPLAAWRARIFELTVAAIARAVSFGMGFVSVTRVGPVPKREECPPIIVCNHISIADAVFILQDVLGCPVAKTGIDAVPVLGPVMTALQSVFVNRSDPDSRKEARDEIRARAMFSDSSYPPIIIFPEGTTSTGVGLLQFKTGAFAPGLPVQPVIVRYPSHYCDPSYQSSAVLSIFRLLTQFVNYAELEYLPVYHPSPEEIADPELYAENLRTLMARALGVPKGHFYFDNQALMPLSSPANKVQE